MAIKYLITTRKKTSNATIGGILWKDLGNIDVFYKLKIIRLVVHI